MAYAEKCCRAWLFVHVGDRILDLAFGGSVKDAAVTCEGLAGLEFAEVANALMAAAAIFERTIFEAIKSFLGKNWGAAGTRYKLVAKSHGAMFGKRHIKYKNATHGAAVTAAYTFMALVNQKIESIRTDTITSEAMLREHFKTTFAACPLLLSGALTVTSALRCVAQQRLASHFRQPHPEGVLIPNGLIWDEVCFEAVGNGTVTLCNPDDSTELATLAASEWVLSDPNWGGSILVKGDTTNLQFRQQAPIEKSDAKGEQAAKK